MANYTYDDFLKAVQSAGLSGGFSDADLRLAQQNPAAGMSILDAKRRYQGAATEAERLQANAAAEQVRSSYGGYTGGADGSGYTLGTLSPSSFPQQTAPSYQNNYQNDIQKLYEQQMNYGGYQNTAPRPSYENRYDAQIDGLVNAMLNRPDFSYDPAADDLYSAYRKQYLREGKRATEDTLGAASAATGGIPSSYAATAASQAGDYYNARLTDKIPELYQLAYQKYLNDFSLDQSKLAAVQGVEQADYAKYLNELSQYNADRNFGYNAWGDGYNMLANNLASARDMEQTDYQKYLNDLAQFNTNRNFDYGVLTDEINKQGADWERQYTLAQLAAAAGDLSYLQRMGIDTSKYPTSGGGSGSGGWDGTFTDADVLAAMISARSGKGSEKDYEILLAAGYTPEQIFEGIDGILPSGFMSSFLPEPAGTGTFSGASLTNPALGTGASGDRVVDNYVQSKKQSGFRPADVAAEVRELNGTGRINERQASQILGRLGIPVYQK